MTIVTKPHIAIAVGSLAGVLLYVPVLNMLKIPSEPGFGLDDVVIGLTFTATIMAASMIIR